MGEGDIKMESIVREPENSKTIIFYGTPAYGHINPTLPMVTALVHRGYKVIYYATKEFQSMIEMHGAQFREYDFSNTKWNPQVGSQIVKLTELVLEFTVEQLETLVEEAKEQNSCAIIHDTLAFWGRVIAGRLQQPAISVNAIISINRYGSKAFWMYAFRFSASSLQQWKSIPRILNYRSQLKKRYNIERMDWLSLLMNQEAFNIYTYPRHMHPDGHKLKEGHFFLGPAAILRRDSAQEEMYPHNNLIYVSLGTIFNDSDSFYHAVMQAFDHTKYQVVISCKNQYDQLVQEEVPENITLKPYVNQKEILKKAVLFISAGGMNSICEAAANGVPCLLYPQQGEQAINAKMFEKLGLGKIIRSEENILEMSEMLLNEFCVNQELVKSFSAIHMDELMDHMENYIDASNEVL